MSEYIDLTFKISENPDMPKWIGFKNPSQVASVIMETRQLVLSQFKNFLPHQLRIK